MSNGVTESKEFGRGTVAYADNLIRDTEVIRLLEVTAVEEESIVNY